MSILRMLTSFLVVPALFQLFWGPIKYRQARRRGYSGVNFIAYTAVSTVVGLTVLIGGVIVGQHGGTTGGGTSPGTTAFRAGGGSSGDPLQSAQVPSTGSRGPDAPTNAPSFEQLPPLTATPAAEPGVSADVLTNVALVRQILTNRIVTVPSANGGGMRDAQAYAYYEQNPTDAGAFAAQYLFRLIRYLHAVNEPVLLEGVFADVSGANQLYGEMLQAFRDHAATDDSGMFSPVVDSRSEPPSGTPAGSALVTYRFSDPQIADPAQTWTLLIEPIDGMWVIARQTES